MYENNHHMNRGLCWSANLLFSQSSQSGLIRCVIPMPTTPRSFDLERSGVNRELKYSHMDSGNKIQTLASTNTCNRQAGLYMSARPQ